MSMSVLALVMIYMLRFLALDDLGMPLLPSVFWQLVFCACIAVCLKEQCVSLCCVLCKIFFMFADNSMCMT